eukprot:1303277-Alexandrium_andersonii.AAC.1
MDQRSFQQLQSLPYDYKYCEHVSMQQCEAGMNEIEAVIEAKISDSEAENKMRGVEAVTSDSGTEQREHDARTSMLSEFEAVAGDCEAQMSEDKAETSEA